jgi:hypothetical protein
MLSAGGEAVLVSQVIHQLHRLLVDTRTAKTSPARSHSSHGATEIADSGKHLSRIGSLVFQTRPKNQWWLLSKISSKGENWGG